MATPAANLESCVAALDLIQAAVGEATNISYGISTKFSQMLSELQNSTAALELMMQSIDRISTELSKNDGKKEESKPVESIAKSDIQEIVSAVNSVKDAVNSANASIGLLVPELSKIDMTIKIMANGLYQQLARVNNNIINASNASASVSSTSIANIEQRAIEISSYMAMAQSSLSSIASDSTNSMITLTAISQGIIALENSIVNLLNGIAIEAVGINSRLDALLSAVSTISASGSGSLNIAPIIAELQNIANLIVDLDSTLVMVGNNIVAQIQMIPGGTTTVSVTGVETRLDQTNQLLDNINNWLDILNANLLGGFDVIDARSVGTQDLLVRQLDEIAQKIQNGGRGPGQDFKGGRKELPAIRPFLDSLKGGIITATMEGGKQLVNVFNAIKSTAKGGMEAGGVAGAAGALAGGAMAAFASLPSILGSVVSMISQFVSALDPAVMQQLQLAMSDLMATIGIGLRPIIQAVIPIIRMFANVLKPVMDALAPVMQELANALIEMAVPYIMLWAEAIFNLIPVIESLIPLFFDFADILTASMPVISFVLDMFARTLQLAIGVFYSLLAGIKTVIAGIIDAGAWLVSWVSKSKSDAMKGAANAVRASADKSAEAAYKAFQKAVGPREKLDFGKRQDTTGMAAKQASYSGIADLGKNLMQAAFGSSTQEAALNTANNTKRIADKMDALVARVGGGPAQERRMAGVRR